jgi:hypothetical protein
MAKFILFYADGPGQSPQIDAAAMEATIARYVAWGERIATAGHMLGGGRLSSIWTDPGRIVSSQGGAVLVVDGPFAETNEVVGGYAVIEADSYDHAVDLCRDHPHIEHGHIIIREVL